MPRWWYIKFFSLIATVYFIMRLHFIDSISCGYNLIWKILIQIYRDSHIWASLILTCSLNCTFQTSWIPSSSHIHSIANCQLNVFWLACKDDWNWTIFNIYSCTGVLKYTSIEYLTIARLKQSHCHLWCFQTMVLASLFICFSMHPVCVWVNAIGIHSHLMQYNQHNFHSLKWPFVVDSSFLKTLRSIQLKNIKKKTTDQTLFDWILSSRTK